MWGHFKLERDESRSLCDIKLCELKTSLHWWTSHNKIQYSHNCLSPSEAEFTVHKRLYTCLGTRIRVVRTWRMTWAIQIQVLHHVLNVMTESCKNFSNSTPCISKIFNCGMWIKYVFLFVYNLWFSNQAKMRLWLFLFCFLIRFY